MTYKYVDPISRGYTKFKLTRKQHNEIFPKRKINWVNKCEYYYMDDKIKIHRFASPLAVILSILLFPVTVLIHGLGSFKEIMGELKRLVNQKQTGYYSSEFVYHDEEKFNKIKELIK